MAGVCAGTHRIGSALNAGQIGSLRVAQDISQNGNAPVSEDTFKSILLKPESAHKKHLKR